MEKASELERELRRLAEDTKRNRQDLPALRLRADILPQLGPDKAIRQALDVLRASQGLSVELVDDASGVRGVLVPVDRYVQLVGAQLAGSGSMNAHPDGRIEPADLAGSDVEQVNPRDTWVPVAGYAPTVARADG